MPSCRNRGLALAVCLTATGAQAGAFCDQIMIQLGAVPMAGEMRLPDGAVGQCATSLDLSGARALNCAWPYAFRTGDAQAAFLVARAALQSCLGAEVAETRDQGVNHPDFYDLRLFRTGQGEVGLSLKDKGALQRTYVFVRIAPAL